MSFLLFNDISFTYPPEADDLDESGKQRIPPVIFDHFSAELPEGFISLVGANGTGKTTFMMLASGRLMPNAGHVFLQEKEPQILGEEQKNLLASVIYQNMEFESEEKVSKLLTTVYSNGALKGKAAGIRQKTAKNDLLSEIIDVFELEPVLGHTLTALSKGEQQRVLLAFSLLYGSASIFMDEPLFAMEPVQKERALTYLREFVHETGTTIYISLHEIELTRRFADKVLLFYPDRRMDFGTPEEVLTNEDLERAYGVPAALLKNSEEFTRQNLKEAADAVARLNPDNH